MATVKSTSVTSLMTKAQQALARNHWFEAERMCTRALDMARNEGDFNLMARIVLPLQEARRQRMQLALDSKKIVIVDEPSVEERKIEAKCYLVQPPLVGADARRMRLLALEREIPAMFLCREPKTQLGLCPVVAIGQVTVRTRIDPPKKWDKPDLAWYVAACEQLGDAAIETLTAPRSLRARSTPCSSGWTLSRITRSSTRSSPRSARKRRTTTSIRMPRRARP